MGDVSRVSQPAAPTPTPLQSQRKPDCAKIYPGDYVYIPAEPSCHFTVHEVKAGESLQRIARRFKVSAAYLCALPDNEHLRVSGKSDSFRAVVDAGKK